MDDRNDEDNESAVRALNTAMHQQASTLENFLDEDDPNPPDGGVPFPWITPVPSDEGKVESASESDVEQSSSVLDEDTPVAPEEGGEEEIDDEFLGELAQLRLSEILLSKEMERANSQAMTSMEKLSATFLDATDDICTAENPPNTQEEIRAIVARERQQKEGGNNDLDPSNSCMIGAGRLLNVRTYDRAMDNAMESMMDAVIDGCQGYQDSNGEQGGPQPGLPQRQSGQPPPPPPSPSPGQQNQQQQSQQPQKTRRQSKQNSQTSPNSGSSASQASSTSLPASSQSESISVESQSRTTINRSNKQARGAPLKSSATGNVPDMLEAEDTLNQAQQTEGNDHPKSGVNNDIDHQDVLSIPTTELQQEHDSHLANDEAPDSSWHFLPKKMPINEEEMPQQIEFKENQQSHLDGSIKDSPPEAVVELNSGESSSKRPSLLKVAKSFSKKVVSSRKINAVQERKDPKAPLIAGTKSMDSSSVPQNSSFPVSVFEVDVEDPDVEEGVEVEAFYQRQMRMTLWERIRSPQQRREWKNQLFKGEWIGVKRIYWVALVLLMLIILLLGLVLLVADNSTSSNQRSVPTEKPVPVSSPYMDMFPPYTQSSFRNPESPQAQAYNWLINDPFLDQYSDERKIQRFALACLYYSTNGSEWVFADRVLQYNTDECQWFYARAGRTTPPSCAIAGGLIEALVLDENNLQGTIPPELFLMTNLKFLSMADNQLMSTIPSRGLDKMTNLKTLNLEQSGLSGPLPVTLGYLESLEELNLAGNRLTGTLPMEAKFLSNLKELRLQRNRLNGTIPGTVLANLKSLKQLYLFKNSFRGPLPPQVGQMQALEDLILYKNAFSSTLPTELGLLYRLQRFWMDRNQLSGTIPKQLGYLQHLIQLNLYSNDLSGTIPAELGSARSLEQIQLNENLLTGYVPDRLCALLPLGGDNDVTRLLSVDCDEVACDCDCTCPRPDTTSSTEDP